MYLANLKIAQHMLAILMSGATATYNYPYSLHLLPNINSTMSDAVYARFST